MTSITRVVLYVLLGPQKYGRYGRVRYAGAGRTLRAAMRVIKRRAETSGRYWVPEPGWCCDEIARGGR